MSDHDYKPKSKVGQWFNDRLPLLTLANHNVRSGNLSLNHCPTFDLGL